jgi:hypothetical protein
MKHTTIYLDEKQHAALQKIATARIGFSEHIRRAIDAYLASYNSK